MGKDRNIKMLSKAEYNQLKEDLLTGTDDFRVLANKYGINVGNVNKLAKQLNIHGCNNRKESIEENKIIPIAVVEEVKEVNEKTNEEAPVEESKKQHRYSAEERFSIAMKIEEMLHSNKQKQEIITELGLTTYYYNKISDEYNLNKVKKVEEEDISIPTTVIEEEEPQQKVTATDLANLMINDSVSDEAIVRGNIEYYIAKSYMDENHNLKYKLSSIFESNNIDPNSIYSIAQDFFRDKIKYLENKAVDKVSIYIDNEKYSYIYIGALIRVLNDMKVNVSFYHFIDGAYVKQDVINTYMLPANDDLFNILSTVKENKLIACVGFKSISDINTDEDFFIVSLNRSRSQYSTAPYSKELFICKNEEIAYNVYRQLVYEQKQYSGAAIHNIVQINEAKFYNNGSPYLEIKDTIAKYLRGINK